MKRVIRHQNQRDRTPTPITGESTVVAVPWEETDVNAIVERYARTGLLPLQTREGIYADVTKLQGDLTERYLWSMERLEEIRTRAAQEEPATHEAANPDQQQSSEAPQPSGDKKPPQGAATSAQPAAERGASEPGGAP